MEALSSLLESQSVSPNGWSYESLKNFDQISPRVQSHLERVYETLYEVLIISIYGAYLHSVWNFGGMLTSVGCIGIIMWLLSTPLNQEEKGFALSMAKRFALLLAAAFFAGASIGPLLELVIEVNPCVLISALLGPAMAFSCFKFAAGLAHSREFLYLGGSLCSGVLVLLWLHFASNIFGGSATTYKFELCFGYFVLVGYIVVHSQVIIEKARLGDKDFVMHVLMLFPNCVPIFVRILKNMLKKSQEKCEEKEEEKDRLSGLRRLIKMMHV